MNKLFHYIALLRMSLCLVLLSISATFSSAALGYEVEADSQNNTIYILLRNTQSNAYTNLNLNHSAPAIVSAVTTSILPSVISANSSDLLAVTLDIPSGTQLGAIGDLTLTISGEMNGLSSDIHLVVPLTVVSSADSAQGIIGSSVPAPDPGGIDSDADGVSDALELAFGSNPFSALLLPGENNAAFVNVPVTGFIGLGVLAAMLLFIRKRRVAQLGSSSLLALCVLVSVDIYSGVATRIQLVAVVPGPPAIVPATATASSTGPAGGAHLTVDGSYSSRWESIHGIDPSWLTLDLGDTYALSHIDIHWEAANAATYLVQGSLDNSQWTTLASLSGGVFGDRLDQVDLSGTYRYVRIYGQTRTSVYGYSIWEAEVYAFTGEVDNPEPPAFSWPAINSAVAIDVEQDVALILSQMSLDEKIGQMVMAEIHAVTSNDIRNYHLGAVLNGGGSWPNNNQTASVADWVSLADSFYLASTDTSNNRTAVPILWGTDAVHGHNNVRGATIFPHNIGLGAANNPVLLKQIAQATALEVAVTVLIGCLHLHLLWCAMIAGGEPTKVIRKTPIL